MDIFLSYAREDKDRVRSLVDIFVAEGWSVFWDQHIPAGETWRSHIGTALEQARCVVVVWSRHSVDSRWVIEEADEGNAKQALVPVLIDAVQPPRGFREVQAADLSSWVPGQPSERLQVLLSDMRGRLGAAAGTAAATPAPSAPSVRTPAAAAPPARPPEPRSRRGLLIGATGVVLVGVIGYAMFRPDPTPPERVTPRDTTASARKPPAGPTQPAWLVIAASLPQGQRAVADRRRSVLAERGIDAVVLPSNDYPLLTPDLLVVALGPFESRDAADAALGRVKPVVPDAYVKRSR